MVRSVIVDAIRFTINQELLCTMDTDIEWWNYAKEVQEQNWPPVDGVKAVKEPTLEVRSAKFVPSAKITADIQAGHLDGQAQLKRWSAGYLQDVISFDRHAFYTTGVASVGGINWNLQHGVPCRDMDDEEFPFSSGVDFKDRILTDIEAENVNAEDDPFCRFPMNLSNNRLHPLPNAILTSTTGSDRFTCWLALIRKGDKHAAGVDRPCVILVGRQNWISHYNTVGTPIAGFSQPTVAMLEGPPVLCDPLIAFYDTATMNQHPPVPIINSASSANTFLYGELIAGAYTQKWDFGDDGIEEYVVKPAPDPQLNFLPSP